jgi:hypothetical protein
MTKQIDTVIDMTASRAAYAKGAGAKLAYINTLSLYLADVPDQVLMEFTADKKDIVPGSHHAKIAAERSALIDKVLAQGIKKEGVRVYWQAAFNGVLAGRGLKRAKMKAGKVTAEKEAGSDSEDVTKTGYTPEKAAAAINQLIAWANGQEEAKFNATQFVEVMNKAVKILIK